MTGIGAAVFHQTAEVFARPLEVALVIGFESLSKQAIPLLPNHVICLAPDF
jgi:hypothetical protein